MNKLNRYSDKVLMRRLSILYEKILSYAEFKIKIDEVKELTEEVKKIKEMLKI